MHKLALNFLFVYVVAILTSGLREKSPIEVYRSLENGREWRYAFFDAMGLANYFGSPTINETWWYMSLAIVLIFVIPLLVLLYKRIGKTLVVLAFFVGTLGISRDMLLSGYLFAAVMGVLFAEENLFERLYNIKVLKNTYVNSLLKLTVAMVLFMLYMLKRESYIYYLDVCVPILLSFIVMEASTLLSFIEKPMSFVGKHSMNMFLIHTLIFEYYFMDFIYGFKYWVFVLLALFITSLLGSIAIEWLKKVLRFNLLIDKLSR